MDPPVIRFYRPVETSSYIRYWEWRAEDGQVHLIYKPGAPYKGKGLSAATLANLRKEVPSGGMIEVWP